MADRHSTFRLLLFLTAIVSPACNQPPQDTPAKTDARPAGLKVQPESLAFTGVVFRDNVPAQTLTVGNQGGGHLSWKVSVSRESGWLRVSRDLAGSETQGVEGPGLSSSPPLTVSVSTAGLAPGVYNGAIDVASNGGNATVRVTLTVRLQSQG